MLNLAFYVINISFQGSFGRDILLFEFCAEALACLIELIVDFFDFCLKTLLSLSLQMLNSVVLSFICPVKLLMNLSDLLVQLINNVIDSLVQILFLISVQFVNDIVDIDNLILQGNIDGFLKIANRALEFFLRLIELVKNIFRFFALFLQPLSVFFKSLLNCVHLGIHGFLGLVL